MIEIPYSFYFHQFPDTNFRSLVEMIKKYKEQYGLDIYGETIECGDDMLNKFIQESGIMALTDYKGYWDRNKTVKMIYSHDHALTWNTDVPNENVIKGYYDLCENNPNTLFYTVDYKDWDDPRVIEANRK